jgi:hypothetical protein
MVREAVPEKFMQRTGTICENRAGRAVACIGVIFGAEQNSVNGPGLAGTADFAAAIVCHRREGPPVAGLCRAWLTGRKFFTDHSKGFACRVCRSSVSFS